MSLAYKYLNLQTNDSVLARLGIDMTQSSLSVYNKCFLNYTTEPKQTSEYVLSQIKNYVEITYSQIDKKDLDINYYIEQINFLMGKKFKNIIDEINITHIISLCDYFKNKDSSNDIMNYYIYWRNQYYIMVWENIVCGKYKVYGLKDKENFMDILNKYWDKINFSNIIEFSNSLNKIKFFGQNINEYINIMIDKFDNIENIKKLIDYIENKIQQTNTVQDNKFTNLSDIETSVDLDDQEKEIKINSSKYNFRFVIEQLKSNGYLLFEEFNKYLKKKYIKTQQIQTIKNDKRIVYYFIYIISNKDSTTTNRKVNEILIGMKNYLEDIGESYYNNLAYRKISVKVKSEKYKMIDLSSYNRENSTFTIFKYSNTTQNNINKFTLSPQIEPYFDMYKSYYNSRYPDREIEFDPIKSTLIVKMIFNKKSYYLHMALIQYIIMDKLFNLKENTGLGIKDLSSQTNILIQNLQDTINSLLYIKLIKYSANTLSIDDMKFYINYDFEYSSNKLSISSLVIPKEQEIKNNRDFLHDRNTIVLSNLYDYAKKNKTFTIDSIYQEMSKNIIPFKIDLEQITNGIKVMLDKEHIIETNINQVKTYEYSE
jgi:hypothetical protein